MEFIMFYPIYILLVTTFLFKGAQTNSLNITSDTIKIPEKNSVVENANVQKNEQIFQENKGKIEEKPLNLYLDSKGHLNEHDSTSGRNSEQSPFTLAIDTKPRQIPIKIPLVIKTGNAKPAPAHFVRLKGIAEKRNSTPNDVNTFNSNKKTKRKKVGVKDMVRSKSIDKPRQHKAKSFKFFEEESDVSNKPLRSKSKSSRQKTSKKSKKLDNRYDSTMQKAKKHSYNDSRHGTRENETACEFNESINSENGAQSILIAKLPTTIQIKTEPKATNDSCEQEYVSHETPITFSGNELEILSPPTSENITFPEVLNDCGVQYPVNLFENKYSVPEVRDYSTSALDPENELSEVITITNRNYQEIEEIRPMLENPEQINVGESPSESCATEALNPVYINPYDSNNSNAQNFETTYNNYFKYMPEKMSAINNEGNIYRYGNVPESFYPYSPMITQIYSSPTKQIVQDIYGMNSGAQTQTTNQDQSKIINICPENFMGRIWRTWKDTKVKITKPKYANNIPFPLAKICNEIKYGSLTARTPAMGGCRTFSRDGYYSNLNTGWPYPYPYQTNRYM